MKIFHVSALSLCVFMTACTDGGGDKGDRFAKFDTTVKIDNQDHNVDAQLFKKLMAIIDSQALFSEHTGGHSSPHQSAWSELQINQDLIRDNLNLEFQCSELAKQLPYGPNSGSGEISIQSSFRSGSGPGSIVFNYNNCAVGEQLVDGKLKVVISEVGYDWIGEAPDIFSIEYQDLYEGEAGLSKYTNGIESYAFRAENHSLAKNTRTYTRNIKVVDNLSGLKYELKNFETVCGDQENSADRWGCLMTGGQLVVDGESDFSLTSEAAFIETIYLGDARTVFTDAKGNKIWLHSDNDTAFFSTVNVDNFEKTQVVDLVNKSVSDISPPPHTRPHANIVILGEHPRGFRTARFAPTLDKYVLLPDSDQSEILLADIDGTVVNQVKLSEYTNDLLISSDGLTLTTAHTDRLRKFSLRNLQSDPEVLDLGLGKVSSFISDNIVKHYIGHNSYAIHSRIVLDNATQGYLSEEIDHSFDSANPSGESLFSYNSRGFSIRDIDNYYASYKQIDTGRTPQRLFFLEDGFILTDGGLVVECPTKCSQDGQYKLSVGAVIANEHPSLGLQRVVAAALHSTQGGDALLLFSTAESTAGFYTYTGVEPGLKGTHFWAVNLSDPSKVKKLILPKDTHSTPASPLVVQQLAYSAEKGFVGLGYWDRPSQRQNTVSFAISPDDIQFDR